MINHQTDQLLILPEVRPQEALVQCGVLYLGTGPPAPDLYGLDSIQQPLSQRYPVDGTNTVQGIDAILSVYDTGIQLSFARQANAVVFFPITSLIYCASVRFTIIENDQSSVTSIIDWRFMPLDKSTSNSTKHPPLFCMIVQRTQILLGEECHGFITKTTDAALALVQTLAKIYANLKPGSLCVKSPIYYQLDRFGRKIDEITNSIYLSPANDEETYLNQIKDESLIRQYLFDSSFVGYFYRTDASIIEQWQLWDDDNSIRSQRPHPPASPFGLHEGLYHDDTTYEIKKCLRHMDEEDHSCSCSCSSKDSTSITTSISTSTCSLSTEYSSKYNRYRSMKKKLNNDKDEIDVSCLQGRVSSFEPNIDNRAQRKPPIIIEKVLPKGAKSSSIQNVKISDRSSEQSSIEFRSPNIHSSSSSLKTPYRINEHGEKITKEGNRIVFMDVIRPNKSQIDDPSHKSAAYPTHRRRTQRTKPAFAINLGRNEHLIDEKQPTYQQNTNTTEKSQNSSRQTNHAIYTNVLKSSDANLRNIHESNRKVDMKSSQLKSISDHSQISNETKHQRSISVTSSKTRQRRSRSSVTAISPINSDKQSKTSSIAPSEQSIPSSLPIMKKEPTKHLTISDEKINKLVSDIYGTNYSVKSSSISSSQKELTSFHNVPSINPSYLTALHYFPANVNRNLFREYRHAY